MAVMAVLGKKIKEEMEEMEGLEEVLHETVLSEEYLQLVLASAWAIKVEVFQIIRLDSEEAEEAAVRLLLVKMSIVPVEEMVEKDMGQSWKVRLVSYTGVEEVAVNEVVDLEEEEPVPVMAMEATLLSTKAAVEEVELELVRRSDLEERAVRVSSSCDIAPIPRPRASAYTTDT
jgi:hypothetical protein